MCNLTDTFDAPQLHTSSMIDGERLLIERRRIGMTQDTLARIAGVSRVYISQIENNRDVDVGVKVLYAIASAIGVSPMYLLGETEDPLRGIVDEEQLPPIKNISLPEGGSEIIELLAGLSDRGRSELLIVAQAIAEVDQQWREYETALDMLEALGGGDFIEAMNNQLTLRAAELGSMDAAISEFRARLEAEESTEQHEQ